jgi:hypothetical protein
MGDKEAQGARAALSLIQIVRRNFRMKKLIVLSVVFALVATAAFAVDLGATVIGNTTLAQSNTADEAEVVGSGNIGRYRIDGGGEAGDGKFGGYFRLDGNGLNGNAWWKPIDQFKLQIGGNGGDGYFAKEGVTGWGFYQTPCDTDVAMGGGNVWGWAYVQNDDWDNGGNYNLYGQNHKFRDVFYGGGRDGGNDLYLMITPIDILGINLQIPFFSSAIDMGGWSKDQTTENILKQTIAQIDLKLDFGNIALTYRGGLGADDDNDDPATIFLYYGGSFGDLAIDFGFSYKMDGKASGESYKNPMGVGLGVKYATDSFGVKLRVAATLAGDDEVTSILADVMPYFSLGDNITAFVSFGVGMLSGDGVKAQHGEDSIMGWHFNPYIQIGEEWGAKFLAGVKVWSGGKLGGNDAITEWVIPIAIIVSF